LGIEWKDDMTTSAKGKVKGEGRIISLNDKFGFLGAQGIKSKVLIIPSSLKADPPFPKLSDVLEVDDIVYFEAVEQPERNGAKYVAVDGSVKVKQRGKDVMYEGEGKIVQLDKNRGYFGFIEADIGNVFFNISAVRPSTNDVTKVLKVGQKVKFRCLPNSEQPNCKWRASLVVPMSKANEFMRHPPTHVHHHPQPLSVSKSATSATSNEDSGNGSRPKSTSFSDYGSSPASPLMFNTAVEPPNGQSTNGFRSHIRSISPVGSNTSGFLDETHRYNIHNSSDMWGSTARSPPTRPTGSVSDGDMVNEFQLPSSTPSDKCINASAMWDTFLQQQQALLHPWYAEGRENFYITNTTANNGHNFNLANNFMNDNVSTGSPMLTPSTLFNDSSDFLFDGITRMNGHVGHHSPPTHSAAPHLLNNSNRSNSVSDPYSLNASIDDGSNADGTGRPYESICRQMVKLAHELNGWKDDGCPFCCNNKLY